MKFAKLFNFAPTVEEPSSSKNLILAVEATQESTAVGLYLPGAKPMDVRLAPCSRYLDCMASVRRNEQRSSVENLAVLTSECFDVAQVDPQSIAIIAHAAGPGSYSSIRVALAFARALALAVKAAPRAYSAFQMRAQSLLMAGEDKVPYYFIALPASAGRVNVAFFDNEKRIFHESGAILEEAQIVPFMRSINRAHPAMRKGVLLDGPERRRLISALENVDARYEERSETSATESTLLLAQIAAVGLFPQQQIAPVEGVPWKERMETVSEARGF